MSVLGIGNALGNIGLQYDFTKLTAKQAFDAAKDLQSQGKLSEEAAGRLEGAAVGVDYAPIDGSAAGSTAHTLADPTQVNWLGYIQQSSNWNHANPGTIGGQSTDVLLSELKQYQTGSAQEYAQNVSNLA